MITHTRIKTWCGPHRQAGLSLVELMIAMTIGLLLIAVVGNVYQAGRRSFQDQDESARLQETGRFVLDTVSRIVMEAGRADVAPDNTLLTLTGIHAASIAIDGRNGAGPDPGTDSLLIRFASATPGEVDCLGFNTGGTAAVPVLVDQNLFLFGTDLRCNTQILALVQPGRLVQIGGHGRILARNVEDFQVVFGLDENGDLSVDRYVDPTVENSPNAVAVRVCVLVRTADRWAPAAQQYVDCNGNVVVARDRRIRRAFTRVIGLRNRLG